MDTAEAESKPNNAITGVIDRVHATFAFIKTESGERLFFLPSAIQRNSPRQFNDLAAGQRAKCVRIEHPRGPRAIDVKVY